VTLLERIDRVGLAVLRGAAALTAGAVAALCLAASAGMLVMTAGEGLSLEVWFSAMLVVASIVLVVHAVQAFSAWLIPIFIEVVIALLTLVWWLSRPFPIAW